jgi:hypothetical protein
MISRKRGKSAGALKRELEALTGGWPRAVGGSLFAIQENRDILWLDKPTALAAWVAGQLGESSGGNPLRWVDRGQDVVSWSQFHSFLSQNAQQYEAVENYPHHPPRDRTFYNHETLGGGDGRQLRELLGFFNPATDVDRDLILALLLSVVWGAGVGARPAFLVTAGDNDEKSGRGVGKSTLVRMVSRLFGGHFEADWTDTIEALKTRLLTPSALGIRLVAWDNLKSNRLSSGAIEGLITAPVVSGHQLFAGEATRPNNLTFLFTVNGASLSKDLAQRVVTIHLERPHFDGGWETRIAEHIDNHRWEILGDLIALLRNPPARPLRGETRWASWEQSVLSRVGNPQACILEIKNRQSETDDDDDSLGEVRDAFADYLSSVKRLTPDECDYLFGTAEACRIMTEATGERFNAKSVRAFFRQHTFTEMKYERTAGLRGYRWTGKNHPDRKSSKGSRSQAA